jgi:hypothetical protein
MKKMQTLTHTTQGSAAFKEWAVSCEALAEGRQVMLFRKGGIKEKGHIFKMEHPHFFLYPTYEHQDPESIKPAYHPLLQSVLDGKPDLGDVRVTHWAQVDEAVPMTSMEPILKQAENHLYSDSCIKARWDWHPNKPLWLLLLRVYKLDEPLKLEVLEDYTGCKSWIDLTLPQGQAPVACKPVLDDAAYEAMAAKVKALL